MSAVITAAGLELGYRGGAPVLRVDQLAVERGRMVSMVGPNGGGKTTLLRCLAGLMPPRRGRVFLGGQSVYGRGALSRRERARMIAVVLTEPVSPAYLRVEELVELGRLPHRRQGDARKRRVVREALDRAGAGALVGRPLGQLSDGERQRVMLARALAQEPQVLLLDEPAAHLDPPHQTALFSLMRDLLEEKVVDLVVLATHHLHLALHFSNQLLVLADGGLRSGTAEELLADAALERAFLAAAEGPAPVPGLRLDALRGWFIPGSS